MGALILVRGVSGTGKSTLGQTLAAEPNTILLEADQFFHSPDGTYTFDVTKLSDAHAWCLTTTKQFLALGWTVVVANTFTRRWELEPYLALGVETRIITVESPLSSAELAARCAHGLTEKQIQAQRDRWEEYPLELVDVARVDLGAAHNGRVARRNVFKRPDGRLVIVDKGRHIPVLCINPKPRRYDIAYVTVTRDRWEF